jgi:hypothetical protein
MPKRIFTGNAAYEYSSWACHTSATKEFILSIVDLQKNRCMKKGLALLIYD